MSEPVVVYEPRDIKPRPSEHTLAENEEVIRRGLGTFVDVGRALMEIRGSFQYKTLGFKSFDAYCQERWGMDRQWASAHISGARVVDALTVVDRRQLPANVEQTKPLAPLLNSDGEEAVQNAWAQIVESHEGEGAITGREIRTFLNPTAGVAPSQRPVSDAYLGALDKLAPAMKGLRWAIKTYGNRKVPKPVQERFAHYAPAIQALADAVESIGNGEVPDPASLEAAKWER